MNADPLAALHPLHLPGAVGGWPPAPLWWLLAVLVLAMLVLGIRALRSLIRRNSYRRRGAQELSAALNAWRESGDAGAFAATASTILRRAALCRYPRPSVAPLHGKAWLEFLDRSGRMQEFARGAGSVIGESVYSAAPACDPQALEQLCRRWLRRHR